MSDSNLPPNLTEEFNNEKVKTKKCPTCKGKGTVEDYYCDKDGIGVRDYKCSTCAGSGQVELTSEEIEELAEEKREKQSQIYNQ